MPTLVLVLVVSRLDPCWIGLASGKGCVAGHWRQLSWEFGEQQPPKNVSSSDGMERFIDVGKLSGNQPSCLAWTVSRCRSSCLRFLPKMNVGVDA